MTITSAVIASSESGFVISVIARSEATKQSLLRLPRALLGRALAMTETPPS